MKHYLVQYEGPQSTAHACMAADPEGAIYKTARMGELDRHMQGNSTALEPVRVLELDPTGLDWTDFLDKHPEYDER